jgi:dipeptidyl aminopeptidase/acylaminoacyl peptidase
MNKGELTANEAETELRELYAGVDSVLKSPDATNKYFKGDTYKWWYYEINKPPIEDLVRLKLPILLTAGSNDSKVPIEGSDYINSEFSRLQKNNLTYKVYLNCDHGYQEMLATGERKDHWNELFTDFLRFIETHNSR